jgi:hypothetical protein
MDEKIKGKIAKLMALAADQGATPDEAASAAAMAASLAARYNIELSSVGKPGEKKFVTQKGSTTFRRRDATAFGMMSSWVGSMFGCSPMFYYRGDTMTSAFSGQEHNIDLCHSWMDYLWGVCLKRNTDHARKADYGSSAVRQQARDSFRMAFAVAVSRRLKTKLDELRAQKFETSAGTSLVVGTWFDQERQELAVWMEENQGDLKPMKAKEVKVLHDAYRAGFKSGDEVGLQDQVAGPGKVRAALTGGK